VAPHTVAVVDVAAGPLQPNVVAVVSIDSLSGAFWMLVIAAVAMLVNSPLAQAAAAHDLARCRDNGKLPLE
jgi:hypothetical protein